MYILAQNKDCIVSTEIGAIKVYLNNTIGFQGNSNIVIGEYDTWKRCTEILQEIANGIEKNMVMYSMPQE